jgi:hypothetical protein
VAKNYFNLFIFYLTTPSLARLYSDEGRAIAQAIIANFPPLRPGFGPRRSHMGFLVNKVALGQDFSEYFDLPCQFSLL